MQIGGPPPDEWDEDEDIEEALDTSHESLSRQGEYSFPLCDLEVVDRRSPNYQVVDDYAVWFANRQERNVCICFNPLRQYAINGKITALRQTAKTKRNDELIRLADAVCRDHIDEEFALLCRKLAAALARKLSLVSWIREKCHPSCWTPSVGRSISIARCKREMN